MKKICLILLSIINVIFFLFACSNGNYIQSALEICEDINIYTRVAISEEDIIIKEQYRGNYGFSHGHPPVYYILVFEEQPFDILSKYDFHKISKEDEKIISDLIISENEKYKMGIPIESFVNWNCPYLFCDKVYIDESKTQFISGFYFIYYTDTNEMIYFMGGD